MGDAIEIRAGHRRAGRAKTRVLRTALSLGAVFTTEYAEVYRTLGNVAAYRLSSRTFRTALSNRTRGRFSAFSPCQRKATGSSPENGAAKNAYNRTHSFRGFDGSVSVGLDLLDLPFPSAHSVVAPQGEQECLSYHKYRPCG